MDAPDWYRAALDAPREDDEVIVDGCRIHYVRWGARDCPGVVLVHGGAAHAHWWDHVAPLLMRDCGVVALDLSGHGDSGRRDRYPTSTWAREIVAVAEHAGIAGSPVVVGHSMGGWVAITAAAEQGDGLDGIVILDSPVSRRAPEEEAAAEGAAFGPLRTYPTLEAALSRFHTVPDQPTSLPYVLDHVAAHVGAHHRRGLDVEVRPADLRSPGPDRRAPPTGPVPRRAVPLRARARHARTSASTCTSSSGGSRPWSRCRSPTTT